MTWRRRRRRQTEVERNLAGPNWDLWLVIYVAEIRQGRAPS